MPQLPTGTVTFLVTDIEGRKTRATSMTMWLEEGRATSLRSTGSAYLVAPPGVPRTWS